MGRIVRNLTNCFCRLPAVDCRVTWPDVTSSTRRPVSVDVSGSLSPARHPTGARFQNLGGDGRTPPRLGEGTHLQEAVAFRLPRRAHVTSVASQLLPVGDDEDTIQSSGITSSPGPVVTNSNSSSSSSSSRPLGDVINPEESTQTASFSRLGHALPGSDLAGWYPATLLALSAALRAGRGITHAGATTSPDTVLPLFPDPRRRTTPEYAAPSATRRPTPSDDIINADDRRIPPAPMLSPFRAPPGWPPHFYLQRRVPGSAERHRAVRRELSRSAESRADEPRRLSVADMLFSDTCGMRTLSHLSRLGPPPATSTSVSPLTSQPLHPETPLTDLHRHRRPYHHTYTGGQLCAVMM